MMLWLGDIALGVGTGNGALTGPTALSEEYANSYARHDVLRGKPVLQYIGQELDTREFTFFFDEGFCNPLTQWALLQSAYLARTSLPLIAAGGFDGRHFVVEKLGREVLKTTRAGRVVRLESTLSLIEAPIPSLLSSALSSAARTASALGTVATKALALR
ncbi:phage tail protein [Ancylobacter sp. A5.8]|uniref:phage tail protein n=1 Tax=Ancylobacter gelatini TaxID=2919920 RepID=UPI001F4E7DE0|nr:phage tail protein [Ancylobacter gelatini]MCJ8142972.1 phage tail protein [Ancylobacter gelatini]